MEETAPCWLNPPSWWKTCCLLFFIIFASTNALKNTLAWIRESTEICLCKEQRGRRPQSVRPGGPIPSLRGPHSPGLLQTVQIKGHTSGGFGAKAKATQPLPLQPCVRHTNTHSKRWMMNNDPFNSHIHSLHRPWMFQALSHSSDLPTLENLRWRNASGPKPFLSAGGAMCGR